MNKQTLPLKKVASYSDTRISAGEISKHNYVGTDNINQNKTGRVDAIYTPVEGNVTEYINGDILVGNIRPYLKKIWYADTRGGSSADVLTIRTTNTRFDSKFVYYSLLRDDFFDYMMQGSKGSKMPRGDKKQVMEFPVPNFAFDGQKSIAAVLSALDDKIELNRKINAELEQMVRTLYDYWFVQFDFPDAHGKPYKTSGGPIKFSPELNREIPETWEVAPLSKLLPVITGKRDANHATSDGKYNFFTCGEEILKCDTFRFEGKSVLVAGNGNFGVKLYNGKFDAYQRTYVLIPNDDKLYTIVYLAVLDRVSALTKGSRGSIIKFITKGDLEEIQIPIPANIEECSELFQSLNTITEKIEANRQQSQNLAHLRDWLLPMLMNGQVSVE